MKKNDFKKKCCDFSKCSFCPLYIYDSLCIVAANYAPVDDDFASVYLNFEDVYLKVKCELERFERDEKNKIQNK